MGVRLLLLIFGFFAWGSYGTLQGQNKEEISALEADFEEFPKAFWFAFDGWMKKLNQGGWVDSVGFVENYRVFDFGLKQGGANPIVKFSLRSEAKDGEHWEFVFSKKNTRWSATEAFRILEDSKIDLYDVSIFSPISLRKFVEKELATSIAKTGVYSGDARTELSTVTPTYKPLVRERGNGAGFHFSLNGKEFIASSSFDLDGRDPEKFLTADTNVEIPVTVVLKESILYSIFTYQREKLAKSPPLKLKNRGRLQRGHPVFVNDGSSWSLGHVSNSDDSSFDVKLIKPLKHAKNGSPVIDGKTGEAVAIFIDDTERESDISIFAMYLKLPHWLTEEVVAEKNLRTSFGITATKPVSSELSKEIQESMIHPNFFKVKPGISKDELFHLFPDLRPRNLTADINPKYLYDNVMFEAARGGGGGGVNFMGFYSINDLTSEQLETTYKFLSHFLGNPGKAIRKDFPGSGGKSLHLVLIWRTENYTAGWQLNSTRSGGFGSSLLFYEGKREDDDFGTYKNAKIYSEPNDEIKLVFERWVAEVESIANK